MPIAGLSDTIEESWILNWIDRFRYYREPPTRAKILTWLRRFAIADQPMAAKLLNVTSVVSESTIQQGYRSALKSLPDWHPVEAERSGRWYFVGWGAAGESGLSMLRSFKEANNMGTAAWNPLFKTPAELPGLKLTREDTLVFVDDFSGSGKQVTDLWPQMSMLIGGSPTAYLILTAATEAAIGIIARETDLEIRCQFVLRGKRLVFSNESVLTPAERTILMKYCKKADGRRPKGYGDCGLAFVLHHKTPNNAVPVLYVNKTAWKGLFPRHLPGMA